MFYVSECPKCRSKKLGGAQDELKQCLSCGALWFEPIPNSPQQVFLQSSVREVGFGGEAGGSKSFSLILDATYQLAQKDYHALLLRRTYKQLSGDDGLISLSKKVYPALGGRYIKSEYLWEFSDYPGTIRFGHIEHDGDQLKYDGHQYAYIGFDELQTFLENMYLYLFSRNRCSNPAASLYMRSTFMPGDVGHHFVKSRFIKPFKNGSGYINKTKFFKRVEGEDTEVSKNDEKAIERTFIPAHLEDNPYLYQDGKGEYEKGLYQLDTVDFRRKKGDWDVKREGLVYHGFTEAGKASYHVPLEKIEGLYHSHDFGAVNQTLGLWAKIDDIYYLVCEEKLKEGTTKERVKTINTRIAEKIGDREPVAGWGGAKGERQQRIDMLQEGLELRPPPISDVESQINIANEMLSSGEMVICSDMVYTIDQLENCTRDAKEGIADKSSWHFLDMVRYFATGIKKGGWVG
jgi:hypothetical protein